MHSAEHYALPPDVGGHSQGAQGELRRMSKYYVISGFTDGEAYLQVMNKQELRTALDDSYWGDDPEIYDTSPGIELGEWGGKIMIIKGEAVLPEAMTTEETQLERVQGQLQSVLASTRATFDSLPEATQLLLAESCRDARCLCWCGCHSGTVFDSAKDLCGECGLVDKKCQCGRYEREG